MPCYLEIDDNNIVVSVSDYTDTPPVVEGIRYVNTGDKFLANHFGDKYLGSLTSYEDKWEIMEKPPIIAPPPIDPMVQMLEGVESLEHKVKQLKAELAQTQEENRLLQEMSQSALGELLLIQAQSLDLKGGV